MEIIYDIYDKDGRFIESIVSSHGFAVEYATKINGTAVWRLPKEITDLYDRLKRAEDLLCGNVLNSVISADPASLKFIDQKVREGSLDAHEVPAKYDGYKVLSKIGP